MSAPPNDHAAAALMTRAAEDPGHAAFVVQGTESRTVVTFGAFVERVALARSFLAARGLAAGDRCALIGSNHPDWCAAWYAIVGHGAVAVTLDPQLPPAALGALIKDSGARFAVVDARAEAMSGGWALERVFGLHDRADGLFSGEAGGAGAGAPGDLVGGGDDLAALLYTSGTTAEPKGVMLSHANLIAAVNGTVAALRADRRDVVLSVLPFFHILAQIGGMAAPLATGTTVTLLPEVDPTRIAAVLRGGGITIFFCVPQFFHMFLRKVRAQVEASPALRRLFPVLLGLNRRLRSVGLNAGKKLFRRIHEALGPQMRVLISGGARLDPEVARTFHALGIDLLQVYGLTETAGTVAIVRPGETVLDTVGRPMPGAEVRIDVPEGRAGAEEPGEILVRGPIVMPGYYQRPKDEALDREGWFHTGDLGYLDRQGFLHVEGRAGDSLVLPSGKKIQPQEIESHLARSAFIADVGVTLADGNGRDPQLHAVVVPDLEAIHAAGTGNVEQTIREEVARLCAELPSYKQVAGVTITREPLPRTTTRKLKRKPLQAWVNASHAAGRVALQPAWREPDRAWVGEPANARVLDLLSARVSRPRAEIHPDLHLDLDLGLDSMARLSLLSDLAVRDPGDVLASVHTVRELAGAVAARPAAGDASAAVAPAPRRRAPRSMALTAVAFALFRFVRFLEQGLLRLRVTGAEHLNPPGAALICPNHQSILDALLMLSVLPWPVFRRTAMVTKPKYAGGALLHPLLRRIGVMAVDASRNLPAAIEESVALLREGAVLIVFPEGTRSWDGELGTFRHGAATIALRTGAPIVPVAIDGTFRVLPRGRGPRGLHPVAVRAGAPIPGDRSGDIQARTDLLRARIASLLAGTDAARLREATATPR